VFHCPQPTNCTLIRTPYTFASTRYQLGTSISLASVGNAQYIVVGVPNAASGYGGFYFLHCASTSTCDEINSQHLYVAQYGRFLGNATAINPTGNLVVAGDAGSGLSYIFLYSCTTESLCTSVGSYQDPNANGMSYTQKHGFKKDYP